MDYKIDSQINNVVLKRIEMTLFGKTFEDYFFDTLYDNNAVERIISTYPTTNIHSIETFIKINENEIISEEKYLKRAVINIDDIVISEHMFNSEVSESSFFLFTNSNDELKEKFRIKHENKLIIKIENYKSINFRQFTPKTTISYKNYSEEYLSFEMKNKTFKTAFVTELKDNTSIDYSYCNNHKLWYDLTIFNYPLKELVNDFKWQISESFYHLILTH